MTIHWNTMTWNLKAIAVVVFLATFAIAFWLVTEWQQAHSGGNIVPTGSEGSVATSTDATTTPAAGGDGAVTSGAPIAVPGAHCGGFIKDAPVCGTGYHCQLKVNMPDTGGVCVANAPTSGTTATTSPIAIGGQATANGTTIGILGLTEDSRCAVDVQCIWAGTVRVRASIDAYNRDFTFTLGEPQAVNGATVTLASVIPAQKYSKQTIAPGDYRFIFTVTRAAASTSGIRGTVSLGPTCPVMRNPPDPGCADKPYATTVTAYRANSTQVVASTQSDAAGAFSFSLPPGSYSVSAKGGATLPRCASVQVDVTASTYTTADISCDTGIR